MYNESVFQSFPMQKTGGDGVGLVMHSQGGISVVLLYLVKLRDEKDGFLCVSYTVIDTRNSDEFTSWFEMQMILFQ